MSDSADIKVSVIIPCYKCATFVETAIASAFTQSVPVEVLAIDDCSPDDTFAKLHELKETKFPELRIFQTPENLGAGGARNVGIENARGEWIAVLDADDEFLPDRLERILAIGKGEPVLSDNLYYYDRIRGISVKKQMDSTGHVIVDFITYTNTSYDSDYATLQPLICRHTLVKEGIRYNLLNYGEDWDFIARILLQGYTMRIDSSYAGYRYSIKENNLSVSPFNDELLIETARGWLIKPEIRKNEEYQQAVRARLAFLQKLQLDRLTGDSRSVSRLHILKIAVKSRPGWEWIGAWIKARFEKG